jgi:predicted NAD-dependent protein-ADP-ribosyltransferase YbiA (DUF1768 family)
LIIDHFTREYAFLHPNARIPGGIHWLKGGILYRGPTMTHVRLAATVEDLDGFLQVMKADTCNEAWKVWRSIPLKLLRNNWNERGEWVLRTCVQRKFDPGDSEKEGLCELLLSTNKAELVYGNKIHDQGLGDCRCNNCPSAGKNLLGRLLMEQRAFIKEQWR